MRYYMVDAFADKLFFGNPAGICIADSFQPDDLMKQIAAENNLSETAFVVRRPDGAFDIRWFTPAVEIDLCGHATLGAAFVIANFVDPAADPIIFHSMSGPLYVTKRGGLYELDFPARPLSPVAITPQMSRAVGAPVLEAYDYLDLFLVLRDEAAVRGLAPSLELTARLPEYTSVVVTAKGDSADFVSRCFAPLEGIPEDPVTGSTHASLVPFWAARLGKKDLVALQVSKRGGRLVCRDAGERVLIAGNAALYLKGEILLP